MTHPAAWSATSAMIYKFKSKAAGDLIMNGPVGDQVLRLIGKSPGASGIIEAGSLAASIAALEQAIAAEGQAPAPASGDAGEADGDKAAERVGLKQRAWPMLTMMKRAQAENADIVWGV